MGSGDRKDIAFLSGMQPGMGWKGFRSVECTRSKSSHSEHSIERNQKAVIYPHKLYIQCYKNFKRHDRAEDQRQDFIRNHVTVKAT